MPGRPLGGRAVRGRPRGGGGGRLELKGDRGPLPGQGGHLYAPAMPLHDPVDDGEAETGAGDPFGGEEGLKDLLADRLDHPDAGIRHVQEHAFQGRRAG